MFQKVSRVGFLVLSVLILLVGAPGFAAPDPDPELEAALEEALEEAMGASDDDSDTESVQAAESSPSATGSGASGSLSRLSVHGFLTQAWADADYTDVPTGPNGAPLGLSPDLFEIFLGIPEGGTTNYRAPALQFRYDMTSKDIFVVQFSSRTTGISPLQEFQDEIELDWAFYERRLTDNTSLKIGRVQIPFGIYNELRDVGTVLPFYRPSSLFYKEDAFTSETVDGLALTHTFFADSSWNLEASAYAGEWTAIQFFPGTDLSGIVRAKDAYGYQLWLTSPWDVRLGTGLISFVQEGGSFLDPINGRRDIFHVSLDASFGRFLVQAELSDESDVQLDFGIAPGAITHLDFSEWYVLVGFDLTEKLRIFGQYEEAFIGQELIPLDINRASRTQREDTALSLNYSFSPSIVLKGEYHWTTSRGVVPFIPDFSTGAFRFRNEIFEAPDGSYSIVALAVSF